MNSRTGEVIWREGSHRGTILVSSCTTIQFLEVSVNIVDFFLFDVDVDVDVVVDVDVDVVLLSS